MKVDQNAFATPPVTPSKTAQSAKEMLRAQTDAGRASSASDASAAGLKVSISAAGRQAVGAADLSPGAQGPASVMEPMIANVSQSPLPKGLVDGIPWPVGIGPPAWPETQGASKVKQLLTTEVPPAPEQRPSVAKAPPGAELVSQAVQAETVAPHAAPLQGGLAGKLPTQKETQSGDEAAKAGRQRRADAAYANAAGPNHHPKPALDLKV
jgi:hypothetical protein